MTKLGNYGDAKLYPPSISQKNIIMRNVLALIMRSSYFLVLGHSYSDVDCISSMLAISLLLKKFHKYVTVYLKEDFPSSVGFFKDICKYNEIELLIGNTEEIEKPDAIIVIDTPKPEMIALDEKILQFFLQKNIPKIEIDHHFSNDARYSGDVPYRLTLRASSSAEIIALLCQKINSHKIVLEKNGICEIYSRNIVMAMVTGMLGDAKMGDYLSTRRDRSFFKYFLTKFDRLLEESHYKGSKNIKNVEEALQLLQKMTSEEIAFYKELKKKVEQKGDIGLLILDEESSYQLQKTINSFSTFVDIVRTLTGELSDTPNLASISLFYYPKAISNFVEVRVRASVAIKGIDFRCIIEKMKVPNGNGGGHPGAICFKLERSYIQDIHNYVASLISCVESLIEKKQDK